MKTADKTISNDVNKLNCEEFNMTNVEVSRWKFLTILKEHKIS